MLNNKRMFKDTVKQPYDGIESSLLQKQCFQNTLNCMWGILRIQYCEEQRKEEK